MACILTHWKMACTQVEMACILTREDGMHAGGNGMHSHAQEDGMHASGNGMHSHALEDGMHAGGNDMHSHAER